MKLTPEQSAEVAQLEEIHEDIIDAKKALEKRIRAQFEHELDAMLRRQSRQANRCLDVGVPKTAIGRAVGTSDWKTISAMINLAKPELELEAEKEAAAVEAAAVEPEQELLEFTFGDGKIYRVKEPYDAVLMYEADERARKEREQQEALEREEFVKSMWGESTTTPTWGSEDDE